MSSQWKSAERKIADDVSNWWCGKKGVLRRSPCSGGWPKRGAEGDIIQVDKTVPELPFVIDVKYRQQWDLDDFVKNPRTCTMLKWYRESYDKLTVKLGKPLWFIYMRKRGKFFLLIEHKLEMDLKAQVGALSIPSFRFQAKGFDLRLFLLKPFLQAVDPKALYGIKFMVRQ